MTLRAHRGHQGAPEENSQITANESASHFQSSGLDVDHTQGSHEGGEGGDGGRVGGLVESEL